MNIQSISGAGISPDGKSVVFVVAQAIHNSWQDTIILTDVVSQQQKKIAPGSSPQWSPDGKLVAYIGDDKGNTAIFIYDIESNSTEFLANIYESDYFIDHYAVNNFCWSPDGKAIAYVSTAPFDVNNETPVFREFTDLLYKTKGGRGRQNYTDKRRTHIWLVSITEKTVKPVFINEFNQHSISFSPDAKKICFISNITGAPDLNQWSRVFSADILTGKVSKISSEKGSAFQPAWSPDGKFIAYLGIKSEISTNDSPAEDTQLYIVPSSGGPAKCVTLSLNRRIEQLSWDPSSAYIYFTAGNAGDVILYRVLVATNEIETVIDTQGKITGYSISRDGKKIVYVHTDTTHLPDIFIHDLRDHLQQQLTSFSNKFLNECELLPAETFWYKSLDGVSIQGWIIKPARFHEDNKYPMVLVIHSGPHNMFGYEFEDRMQLLSASGYGVLFINPRGSSGYGQQFSNGSMRAWGEGDYEDLMLGVDEAIKNNKWIDPSLLGVTGQSYGGYMTNRIITKTKRFRAAVADGSISNLISFAGTSLYHSLMESEYQLSVYDNYDELWKCSPLKDVKNVSTPILFLHGETDNEVPLSQAEEMFIALKKLGVTTSFIQYTGEGHGWRPDLKPETKVDLLKRMISWFDKHIKNSSNEKSK